MTKPAIAKLLGYVYESDLLQITCIPFSSMPKQARKKRQRASQVNRRRHFETLEPRLALAADLVITEFLASNDNTLLDDNGNSSDWIEIFNAGDSVADLTGHTLTDDPTEIDKFTFGSGSLAPGEYLVVFANNDDNPSQGSDIYTEFRLSAGGEYVGLYDPAGQVLSEFGVGGADYPAQATDVSYGLAFDTQSAPVTLIEAGADARFLNPSNSSVDSIWFQPGFDDSSWTLGPTPFGYENAPTSSNSFDELFSPLGSDGFDGVDVTGGNTSVSTPTLYVRFEFEVANAASVADLMLDLQWEDGFIAYLNGTRVEARNAPATPQFNSTTGGVTHPDGQALQFESFSLNDDLASLQEGTNVLAIHVINATSGSSDMLLNARLTAQFGDGILREPREVGFLQSPTPGSANTGLRASRVLFSRDSGVFETPFSLALTPETPGDEVRFSLDGSVPTQSSQLYTGPINITNSVEVRARAFSATNQPGDIAGETYVELDTSNDLDPRFPTLAGFTSNLPILVLDNYGAGNPLDRNFNTTFLATYEPDPVTGVASLSDDPTVATRAATHRRGSSSFTLGKNNFRLELRDQSDQDENISLLGLPSESDFILNTFARFDRALIRNPLAFDTNLQLDVYAPRTRYVEVFFNQDGDALEESDYFGVYVLQETIKRDDNRVDIANLEPTDTDITGGYIFRSDRNNGGDPSFRTSRNFPTNSGSTFVIDEPNASDLTAAQRNFLQQYVQDFEDALFGPNFQDPDTGLGYEEFIDVDSFIDQHIFHLFFKDPDSFRFSSYFYKDRGEKLKAGPNWDQERIAGVETDTSTNRARNPENWYGDGSVTQLFEYDWWDRLFDDPNFMQRWIDRWEELRQTIYNPTNINSLIDNYVAQLTGGSSTDNAVIRNFTRWGDDASNGSSGADNNGGEAWPNARVRTSLNPNSNAFYNFADPSITQGFGDPQSTRAPDDIFAYWQSEVDHVRNWIELRLGWVYGQLSDLAGFTVPEGSVDPGSQVNLTLPSTAAPGSQVWYTLDGTDPRDSSDGNKGNPSPSAILWDGSPITINNSTLITARILDSTIQNPKSQVLGQSNAFDIWSAASTALFETGTTVQESLRIVEINYNPAEPTTGELLVDPSFENNDFEFIEVQNISTLDSLNLNGTQIADGVSFSFGNTVLAPGGRALIVEDVNAFEARYGTGLNVIGEWSGALSNSGEQITILDNLGQEVLEVTYNDVDPWSIAADGDGATLVLDDPAGTPSEELGKYYRWRNSTEIGGTPGAASAPSAGVVINEVLAHTDLPSVDAIELFNPTGAAIDLSGWLLSDDGSDLQKFVIPANTVLAAGGYITFDESDFNPTPATPGTNDFALDSSGDEVYLTRPVAGGGLEFVDVVDFGASLNGESLGRTPDGNGRLAPMQEVTLGAANSQPRIAGVVISEVNYHPSDPTAVAQAAFQAIAGVGENLIDNDLEFIEIYNATAATVNLADWRLRGESDFNFGNGTVTSLAAGATLVVVSFDPTTDPARLDGFRTHYGIGSEVAIVGGFDGSLSNGFGRVTLQMPDGSAALGLTHVTADELLYDDLGPWPTEADGGGPALQRVGPTLYGNAAETWFAAAPTPGDDNLTPELTGNYNRNRVVDVADYLLWQDAFGDSRAVNTDGNGDGLVNAADYTIWRDNLGQSLPSPVLNAPLALAANSSDSTDSDASTSLGATTPPDAISFAVLPSLLASPLPATTNQTDIGSDPLNTLADASDSDRTGTALLLAFEAYQKQANEQDEPDTFELADETTTEQEVDESNHAALDELFGNLLP